MSKGLAIVNAYEILPGAEHFYERMKEEFAKLGISLDLKTNSEILSHLSSEGTLCGQALACDFILYLDKDLYLSHELEKLGYRLFNKADSIELCDDKMLTYLALANHGIKMPKTISGPLNYSGDISLAFLKNLQKELSFPFVAKTNFGSLGQGVYLLKNPEDLLAFETQHGGEPRLYQEFIASSKGHDFRIVVIGGKVVAAMKRISDTGDFRSNIALGGHGEKVDLDSKFAELAEKTCKILSLDYAGIDVLTGPKGEPILCEANSNAFIAGIEKTTGINVAALYARYIQKQISR
jgi:gamma-F420-2:alpha-L-glutamate ligase